MRNTPRRRWGTRLMRASRDVLVGVVSQGVLLLIATVIGLIRKYGVVGLIVFTGAAGILCILGGLISGVEAEHARHKRSRPKKTIEALEDVSTAFVVLAWLNSITFLAAIIFGIFQAENS